jgi:hypothetical protein
MHSRKDGRWAACCWTLLSLKYIYLATATTIKDRAETKMNDIPHWDKDSNRTQLALMQHPCSAAGKETTKQRSSSHSSMSQQQSETNYGRITPHKTHLIKSLVALIQHVCFNPFLSSVSKSSNVLCFKKVKKLRLSF